MECGVVAQYGYMALVQGPITPRRGYRRWFYAPNGTWDAPRIVAAMRAWAEETGAPPRSWEWYPGSARSAGLMGDAESKWEREHPRWPGNTTVYRYFDSWASALLAAGLRPFARRDCELPLAERVALSRRLAAAGLPVREIAAELGVGIPSVYRYLKAHECSRCGDPVVGPGTRCQPCAARGSNPKRWSAQELLDAVAEWEQLEGPPAGYRRTGVPRPVVGGATAGSASSLAGRRPAQRESCSVAGQR